MSLNLYQYYVVTRNYDNTLDYEAGPFASHGEASDYKREHYKFDPDVAIFEACLEGRCF